MAKNYEFRPDKPQVSWLSKLHMTQLQRQSLLKWTLYALLLLVLSLPPRFRRTASIKSMVYLGEVSLCRFQAWRMMPTMPRI